MSNSPLAHIAASRWPRAALAVLLTLLAAVSAIGGVGGPQHSGGRAGSGGGGIFEIDGQRPERIVVTAGEELPALTEPSSPMLAALAGVLGEYRGAQVGAWRAAVEPDDRTTADPAGAERVCVVHLLGKGWGGAKGGVEGGMKRVEVIRAPDGSVFARELDGDGEDATAAGGGGLRRAATLSAARFRALSAGWPLYRGPFTDTADRPALGMTTELSRPYVPGRFTIDRATLSERLRNGRPTDLAAATRVLDEERLFVRLPKSHDPRTPAGLLVWIDAGPEGKPPAAFDAALDELGLIAVGAANSGNGRHVSERYQLAFDAVATASRRFHVDPRRVYISGISGGGKVASILAGCFPDAFTACVPIVGLSAYEHVPTGTGAFWPAAYSRPPTKLFALLKTRRMAPITGSKDYNATEIAHASRLLEKDGLRIRLFNYDGMGHELPTPERLLEALTWADEPYRKAREVEQQAAKEVMRGYAELMAGGGEGGAGGAGERGRGPRRRGRSW